jgi:hypothetical protein
VKTSNQHFIVYDYRWVAKGSAFALNVLANFLFILFFAQVHIHILVFDVVVFQKLFGHFAPSACAERVQNNLVLAFFA